MVRGQKTTKKTLFLSFGDLLNLLKLEIVDPKDLDDPEALFFFGCTPAHLEDPYDQNVDVRRVFDLSAPSADQAKAEMASRVYDTIKRAVAKAGPTKVHFRDPSIPIDLLTGSLKFSTLNNFLIKNGVELGSKAVNNDQDLTYRKAVNAYGNLVTIFSLSNPKLLKNYEKRA